MFMLFWNSFPDAGECGVEARAALRARSEDGNTTAWRRCLRREKKSADGQVCCQHFGFSRCQTLWNAGKYIYLPPPSPLLPPYLPPPSAPPHSPLFFSFWLLWILFFANNQTSKKHMNRYIILDRVLWVLEMAIAFYCYHHYTEIDFSHID